jgi:hypothetical protein
MLTECSVEGCARARHSSRGYCSLHYGRWRRTGDPEYAHDRKGQRVDEAPPRPVRVCGIDDCGRPHKAHGLCELHHTRAKRGQDVLAAPARREHARTHEAALRALAKKLVELQVVEHQEDAQRLVATLVLVWPGASPVWEEVGDARLEVLGEVGGPSLFGL